MKAYKKLKVAVALEAEKGNISISSLAKRFRVEERYIIACRNQLIYGSSGLLRLFSDQHDIEIERPHCRRPDFIS